MKRLIEIFILLFYIPICYAQNVVTYNNTKYYWGDSIYTLNTIQSFVRFDSVLFIACGIVDSLHDQRLTLVKTDLEGNLISKIKLGSTNYKLATYPGNSIILDKDTDLLVCSAIIYDSTYFTDGFIVKLNQGLDTIWSMVDRLPDSLAGCNPGEDPVNFLTAIKESPEGGYIAVGNYYKNCIANNLYTYLIKFDFAGNVLWNKVYDDIKFTYDIEIAPDSGYLFLSLPTRGFDVVKTDKFGNKEWKYSIENSYIHRLGQDIELVNDSIVVIVGQYIYDETSGTYPNAADVYKININTKQKIWEKRYYLYQNFKCATLHQNLTLKILNNGDIIICGTARAVNYDSTAGGYKGILLKLSSNGDSLWSHYYNYGDFKDECQFNDIVLTDDGGFLAAGYHFPYDGSYNSGAWLVKMDSNGIAPGCFTQHVQEISGNDFSIEVYPNPARDVVNVRLATSQKLQATRFELVDMFGKVIRRKLMEYNENNFSFSVNKLPEGLYVLRIMVNDGMINRKIIVVK